MLRNPKFLLVCVSLGICLSSVGASSQQLDLAEIGEISSEVCGEHFNGKTESKQRIDVEAKAKIKGLIQKLVGAGIDADAEFLSSRTIGLLDEMLVRDRASTRECKLEVLGLFMELNGHSHNQGLPSTSHATNINQPKGTILNGDIDIENAIFGDNLGESAGKSSLHNLYYECRRPSSDGTAWYVVSPRHNRDFIELMKNEVSPDDHKFLLDALFTIGDHHGVSTETFDSQIRSFDSRIKSKEKSIEVYRQIVAANNIRVNQIENTNFSNTPDYLDLAKNDLEKSRADLQQLGVILRSIKLDRQQHIEQLEQHIETAKEISTLKPRACEIIVTTHERLETAK